jgi:hypothetical protein
MESDTELREAVKRLMAFRHEVLRPLRKSYDDKNYSYYADNNSGTMHTLRLMNDPVWHRVEEALK